MLAQVTAKNFRDPFWDAVYINYIYVQYNLIFRQNCGHSEGGFENSRCTIKAHIGMSTATPLLTLKVQCATWGRWKSISLRSKLTPHLSPQAAGLQLNAQVVRPERYLRRCACCRTTPGRARTRTSDTTTTPRNAPAGSSTTAVASATTTTSST